MMDHLNVSETVLRQLQYFERPATHLIVTHQAVSPFAHFGHRDYSSAYHQKRQCAPPAPDSLEPAARIPAAPPPRLGLVRNQKEVLLAVPNSNITASREAVKAT